MRLYSWSPERRASAAHIRHFIAQAVERKAWAATKPAVWRDASQMSQEMLAEVRASSIKQIARKAMEYARYRAFMPGAYSGWPGDKPAHDLWQSLAA